MMAYMASVANGAIVPGEFPVEYSQISTSDTDLSR
jgi:hypothetical protein